MSQTHSSTTSWSRRRARILSLAEYHHDLTQLRRAASQSNTAPDVAIQQDHVLTNTVCELTPETKDDPMSSEIIWKLEFTCYGCKKKKKIEQPIMMRNPRTGRQVSICEACAKKNAEHQSRIAK